MARHIEANSTRQSERGFQNVALGKITHSKLKQLAYSRGVSMAHYIKEVVERDSSGSQGELLTHKATVVEVKAELAEAQGNIEHMARFMATFLAQAGDYESGRYNERKESVVRGLNTLARLIQGDKGEVAREQKLGFEFE